MRFASTADYEKNYSTGYYGHAQSSTSFDTEKLPPIIASLAQDSSSAVVDIGGDNGNLQKFLEAYGISCVTIDIADREDAKYIRADLSSGSNADIGSVADRVRAQIQGAFLCTCFDVIEHIDIEDLPNFIYNIGQICDKDIILSVSTRPSSRGNRYHTAIFPVSTWEKLFRFCGFDVSPLDALNDIRNDHKFSGSDEVLSVVSHWQRRNPFRDHVSHQHYLHLKRVELPPAREEFYSNCADLLDFSYRFEKRQTIFAEAEFRGNLIYSVNFIQDWSFARSIMDVVPTGKFKLILRSDIIAPEYTHFIRNFCIRTGIDFVEITSVNQGVEALERWRGPYALFVTATEGLISATHLMNSLLTLEARRMGYATLSMQHGMNVGKDLSHAAEYVGAWDAKGAQSLQSGRHPGSGWHVLDAGSPKFFEALMPMGENAFAQRFGDWTHAFRKKVLVGLNLHWRIGEESDVTYRWLESVFARYPDILFILRPHPDDYTIFENSISASNVLILDEVILNVVDWPMSRIIKSVDAVITTFSTLILDALAAETPVYMLPTDFSRLDGYFLPISLPVTSLEDFSQVTREEFANGLLPAGLFEVPVAHDRAWFDSSRRFFSRLASLRTGRNVGRLAAAEQDVRRALETAVKTLNFDVNPHGDRVKVSEGIRMFQTESF